tara:strand:+ start:201 stop:533 length:333 start_codon:yes stop_codon:yes gene_type:complete
MNYWAGFTDNKVSPKKLTVPDIMGISQQKSGLDLATVGKKLYNLVGFDLNPLSRSFGKAGRGIPGSVDFNIGEKWNVGMWHDMSNPFSPRGYGVPSEPKSEFGIQVSRSF